MGINIEAIQCVVPTAWLALVLVHATSTVTALLHRFQGLPPLTLPPRFGPSCPNLFPLRKYAADLAINQREKAKEGRQAQEINVQNIVCELSD